MFTLLSFCESSAEIWQLVGKIINIIKIVIPIIIVVLAMLDLGKAVMAGEEKQIKEMMREQKVDSFSEFLRQNLLKKNYQDRIFESWFSLWQSQKFEQISRDVHEVLVVARENHQVTQEHVSILLTCVQELIAEVNQVQPLSRGFREKYLR